MTSLPASALPTASSTLTGPLLLDGKLEAQRLRHDLAGRVMEFVARHARAPGLAVVLVGDNPASQVYVASKARQSVEIGLKSFEHRLPGQTSQHALLDLIAQLNADPLVDGILVQLPLPAQINANAVLEAIDPGKDVDGFHPVNAGRLATGQKGLVPCTPLGCLALARLALPRLGRDSFDGLHAVVVGRSTIVGKPVAQLLLAENCTVTIAHSRTRDLAGLCASADLLVAAIGRPLALGQNHVREGAIVIDVGINRIPREGGGSRLVGDVDFDAVAARCAAITPVPGGVGPMTIAFLLANTVTAAWQRAGI